MSSTCYSKTRSFICKIHLLMLIVICFPQLKYKEDYNKNVKGQWCETPYFDVAIARMAMDNFSNVRAYYYIRGRIFRMPFVCHFSASDCRSLLFSEKIHATLWGHERPNLFHANRHARLWRKQEGSYCCQWGKCTQTHHTQRYQSVFIGPISCGRHGRELTPVSEQSVSQRTESSVTQGLTALCPHMHFMTERSTFDPPLLHKLSV